MGIFCEINLCKSSNEVFVPGDTVSGIIKYAVNEDTVFNKITVSLKGLGRLYLEDYPDDSTKSEKYVDIDCVIHNSEKVVPVGSYETDFSFILPHNIPSSIKYKKNVIDEINCKICYYIRIKFDRGFMKFAKSFKKDITVVSGITPTLPMNPVICGEQKVLTKIFSSKKNIVNIKARIEKCVYKPGEKIKLEFEITNDTNHKINEIETKLMEVHHFDTGSNKADVSKPIKGTESKHGCIEIGDIRNMYAEIVIPADKCSLEYSNIVSRYYAVHIIAKLPVPHRDAVLEIRTQVGDSNITNSASCYNQSPPSYWEVMSEEVKDLDVYFGDKKGKGSAKKGLI